MAADENCNDPDTWHGLLAQDLEQTAWIMHKELGAMPPYSCKPEEWHKLDFPGAWKLLVKRFAQRLQETCWSSQDGDIAGDGQLVHLTSDLDGVHTCTDCGKLWVDAYTTSEGALNADARFVAPVVDGLPEKPPSI